MSDRRDLGAILRQAARAMPATERLRFSRFLRGLEGRERPDVVPGTPYGPAVTIGRDPAPPRPQPTSRPECDWYYGGDCNCSGRHRPGPRVYAGVQLRLPLFRD